MNASSQGDHHGGGGGGDGAAAALLSPSVTEGPLVTGPLGHLVTPPSTDQPLENGNVIWNEDAIGGLLRRWGGDRDERFACPLPGHRGRAFLAVPPADKDPAQQLRLMCSCWSNRWRSLGEVRAQEAGRPGKLSSIELLTWNRRLAADIGHLHPASVRLLSVEDVPTSVEKVRSGFALLLGLRWLDREPEPVAYSIRFVAAWCDVSFREAREGIAVLKRGGVIDVTGRQGRCDLYLPAQMSRPEPEVGRDRANGDARDARTENGLGQVDRKWLGEDYDDQDQAA